MTGKLIVLEGLSNAGKTSLCDAIQRNLKSRGFRVDCAKELSTPVGQALDRLFRDKVAMGPDFKALAFATDRRMLVSQTIRPSLASGNHVIVDRYTLTNLVYRELEGCSESWLESLDKGIPHPALTIIVDISPKTSVSRALACGKPTPNSELFLSLVRERYLKLAKLEEYVVVDGEREFSSVAAECCEFIQAFLTACSRQEQM